MSESTADFFYMLYFTALFLTSILFSPSIQVLTVRLAGTILTVQASKTFGHGHFCAHFFLKLNTVFNLRKKCAQKCPCSTCCDGIIQAPPPTLFRTRDTVFSFTRRRACSRVQTGLTIISGCCYFFRVANSLVKKNAVPNIYFALPIRSIKLFYVSLFPAFPLISVSFHFILHHNWSKPVHVLLPTHNMVIQFL